jgi:hypothetical protein
MTENTVRRVSVPCRMMLAGTAGVISNRLRSTSAPGQPIQCSDLHLQHGEGVGDQLQNDAHTLGQGGLRSLDESDQGCNSALRVIWTWSAKLPYRPAAVVLPHQTLDRCNIRPRATMIPTFSLTWKGSPQMESCTSIGLYLPKGTVIGRIPGS